jgi:hypothetical protein
MQVKIRHGVLGRLRLTRQNQSTEARPGSLLPDAAPPAERGKDRDATHPWAPATRPLLPFLPAPRESALRVHESRGQATQSPLPMAVRRNRHAPIKGQPQTRTFCWSEDVLAHRALCSNTFRSARCASSVCSSQRPLSAWTVVSLRILRSFSLLDQFRPSTLLTERRLRRSAPHGKGTWTVV